MTYRLPLLWGLAIFAVALLNIVDVLPDWATIAAILTLPLLASVTRMRCEIPRKKIVND